MPLVVYYFGRLSIISFLANLLIIPVQPPIMIAGGLATLAGFVFLPLAKLIALIPYASLWWTVFVVEKTGGRALGFDGSQRFWADAGRAVLSGLRLWDFCGGCCGRSKARPALCPKRGVRNSPAAPCWPGC